MCCDIQPTKERGSSVSERCLFYHCVVNTFFVTRFYHAVMPGTGHFSVFIRWYEIGLNDMPFAVVVPRLVTIG